MKFDLSVKPGDLVVTKTNGWSIELLRHEKRKGLHYWHAIGKMTQDDVGILIGVEDPINNGEAPMGYVMLNNGSCHGYVSVESIRKLR